MKGEAWARKVHFRDVTLQAAVERTVNPGVGHEELQEK